MAKNENLHKARDAKKDEFYTQYEDIQRELASRHIIDHKVKQEKMTGNNK